MPFRIGTALTVVVALVGLGGCTGAGSAPPSYMQSCLAKATTEAQRSECAWSNAQRMASGR